MLNRFFAFVHHNYLCLKILDPQVPITILGEYDKDHKGFHLQKTKHIEPKIRAVNILSNNVQLNLHLRKLSQNLTPKLTWRKYIYYGLGSHGQIISAEFPLEQQRELLTLLKKECGPLHLVPCGHDRSSPRSDTNQLAIKPDLPSVKQRPHKFSWKKREDMKLEVENIKNAKLIWEVLHPEWLANPVLV